jgi:hypothetical protein
MVNKIKHIFIVFVFPTKSVFKHQTVQCVHALRRRFLSNQVTITTKVVTSNPAHGEVYSIQHYVMKFVSDLRQVGGFPLVLRFPPPIKLTVTI